jgi:hypothetical protein
MTRTLRLAVALAVALGLGLAGCGGDDDEPAAGDDLDQTCLDAVRAWTGVISSVGDGLEAAQEDLVGFEAYAERAPQAIRADVQVLAGAYRRYVEVLEETGFDPTSGAVPDEETMALLEEAAEELDRDEVTEADEAVSEYFEAHCGG